MDQNLIARASTTIDAPDSEVWHALVSPAAIKEYMFGATVQSDWRVGSPITWSGTWQGKDYEDKGEIVRIASPYLLEYTHYSPLSGKPDVPENYHTVTIEVMGNEGHSTVVLSQDGNRTEDERIHSRKNWQTMLAGLKKYAEEHTHVAA